MTGLPDGTVLIISAVEKALLRCNFRGTAFLPTVKGVEGLAALIAMDEKDVLKQRGIGPKTWQVIEQTRKIILECIAQNAIEVMEKRKNMEKAPS